MSERTRLSGSTHPQQRRGQADGEPPLRERAVALRYNQEHNAAPKVVAKGSGETAQRILAVAQNHGIPIHQDAALVELLAQVELNRDIPTELYAAVAEILSWIYRANETLKKEMFSS